MIGCQGKRELRGKVESLLQSQTEVAPSQETLSVRDAAGPAGDTAPGSAPADSRRPPDPEDESTLIMRPPVPGLRQLGRYRVSTLIGLGGMGEVYRAHDTLLKRDVAVKVLRPESVHDPESLDG